MKNWIVRNYIALAEAFDWPVPDWIRRWLPTGRAEAMLARERALTGALRSGKGTVPQKPDNLEFLIESRLAAAGRTEQPTASSRIGFLIPLGAIAAAAVLGLYILSAPETRPPATGTEMVVQESEPVPTVVPGMNLPDTPALALIARQDLLMRPLARERDRLTADLTSALKYVARGIVPDPYVERVNARLDALSEGSAPQS